MPSCRTLLAAAVAGAALLLAAPVESVDRSKFRKCNDAGFCKRHRNKAAEPETRIREGTVSLDAAGAKLKAQVDVVGAPHLELSVSFYESGIARIRLTESDTSKPPRWESPDIILPAGTKPASSVELLSASSSAAAAGSSLEALVAAISAKHKPHNAPVTFVTYNAQSAIQAGLGSGSAQGQGQRFLLALFHHPFKAELYHVPAEGEKVGDMPVPLVVVNGRGLSFFEHRRLKGEGGSQLAAAAANAAASSGQQHSDGHKRIVDWGEDGRPIYEDGTHGDGDDAALGGHEDPASAARSLSGSDALAAGSLDADQPGMWEESFGSHHDSKPNGPTAVGVDVSFPFATSAYGIPEHATSHSLAPTDSLGEPYRLYNLDVFEYELGWQAKDASAMALYGSIPFLLAHGVSPASSSASSGGGVTAGIYWNNPTESYVDLSKQEAAGVETRWISESGNWDLSLVPGVPPSVASAAGTTPAKAVISQYTRLTGTQALPPLFALGYHQCRWNYKDEADVLAVDAKFEEHSFPYEVLWLDIEHTDGKRYFTWDDRLFPDPRGMQDKLWSRGRRMVTIIDPHIKKDSSLSNGQPYQIHGEAVSKGLYIKNAKGDDYEGWCWPGSSGYLDFTSPKVREWWSDQFSLSNYKGSTLSLYTWNDMNEPSVFNGPEVSMNKDAKSLEGVEHREWHNLYGFYQQMATAEGQIKRSPGQNSRPFVLSRAFFAGSQRHGAIWTGDNAANWEHLAAASPMLLTIGAAGLTFAGADVGGFFNNPSTELMIRWYQAGSFQPFFRAHAHIDTARREPWLFGDDVLNSLRDIVRTRYSYLPYWYSLFYEANATGVPTMRPLWMEYPDQPALFDIDDQWLVGKDLLVKPVTAAGASSLDVHFPARTTWYDVVTYETVKGTGAKQGVSAPLNKIPVYQRGGSILPRQMRPRRSSVQMAADPYTLVVALDEQGKASGSLYLDDGNTFDYIKRGAFRHRLFDFETAPSATAATLKSSAAAGSGKSWAPSNTVERIVILGLNGKIPRGVAAFEGSSATATDGVVSGGRVLSFEFDEKTDSLTIRRPDLKIAYDWSVTLSF